MTRTIPESEYAERRERARDALFQHNLDAIIIGPSNDLHYFYGQPFRLGDRPALLIITKEWTRLSAPELEAVELESVPSDIEVVSWRDGEDLVEVSVAGLEDFRRVGLADELPFWVSEGVRARLGERVCSAASLTRSARQLKSETELELMRVASSAADLAYQELQQHRLVGRSEAEVSQLIAQLLEKYGCDPGTGGSLVAAGPAAAHPHHGATDYVIQSGDVVIIDYGGRVDGYCSDCSRTFVVGGEPSEELQRVHRAVLEANQAAFDAVKPGVPFEVVDQRARAVIEQYGYGDAFLHRTGHGIGIDVHEHPYVVAGETTVAAPGMTFTIEPGVYIEGVGGVRIEDVVLVTESGAESLNTTTRELLQVA